MKAPFPGLCALRLQLGLAQEDGHLLLKKKHGVQSATYAASAFTWDGAHLALARTDTPLHLVWPRPLPDGCKPTSVTVTKDCAGRYFVSLLIEEDLHSLPVTAQRAGLGLG